MEYGQRARQWNGWTEGNAHDGRVGLARDGAGEDGIQMDREQCAQYRTMVNAHNGSGRRGEHEVHEVVRRVKGGEPSDRPGI